MSPHKERKGSPHKENSLDIVETRPSKKRNRKNALHMEKNALHIKSPSIKGEEPPK